MDAPKVAKIALLACLVCLLIVSTHGQQWGGSMGGPGLTSGQWGGGGRGDSWGHGGGSWGQQCRCARYCRYYERVSGTCGAFIYPPLRRCCRSRRGF